MYVINSTTGALTTPPSPVTQFSLGQGNVVAHPVEPFIYVLEGGQIHVFEIEDLPTGAVLELNDSPYVIQGAAGSAGLVLTHNAATQIATPHAAKLVPSAIDFDDTNIGQASPAAPSVAPTAAATAPPNRFPPAKSPISPSSS